MEKKEVEVSARVTIPLWTAGALYTAGLLLSWPSGEFFAGPWYEQVTTCLAVYILWPLFLGMIHAGGP